MRFYYVPPIAQFYGWSASELIDKTQIKLQIDPELLKLSEKQRANVFVTGEKELLELFYTSSKGEKYHFDTIIVPEFEDKEVTSVLVISRDVTGRKEAEDKLKERTAELEEAYNFLRTIETARKQEIHHRIKNNLQVISSLLDLQAEKFNNRECIKDSEVLEAFKESQDRIISIALIHEELHESGEIDTLNFSHYIDELADNLLMTYRVGIEGISMDMDIEEDIFFDMDTAIPLGIIVNELVSNSLKYAFIWRDKGEKRIKLSRGGNTGEYMDSIEERKNEGRKSTTFTLSISDNGVGIPEDLEIEDIDSLGLQLVTTLVEQLDGELELKRNNGTEFIIRFSVTGNNDQKLTQDQLQIANND